jgi:cation transport protein ChaC
MAASAKPADAIERGESFVGSDRSAAEERTLCREDLVGNILRRGLERSPCAAELLSEQALEDSLQAVLCAPHRQPDVWVFAYGSLIWNPVLEFDERVVGTVHG